MTSVEVLDEAIKVVKFNLLQEQNLGRIVSEEAEGRWAVYDGPLVKMLWIENEAGLPVSIPPVLEARAGV